MCSQAQGAGTITDTSENISRMAYGLATVPQAQKAELAAKRCLQEVGRTERRLVWTRERQNALARIILEHFGSGAVRQVRRETCVWSLDDVMDGDIWETQCDQAFQFNDGGPEDNHFKFCYCCGRPLEVLRRTESEGVDAAAALRAEGEGESEPELCVRCGVPLTSADYEGERCSQCKEPI